MPEVAYIPEMSTPCVWALTPEHAITLRNECLALLEGAPDSKDCPAEEEAVWTEMTNLVEVINKFLGQ